MAPDEGREEKRMRIRQRFCADCEAWVETLAGEGVEVYRGTQIIHHPLTCLPVRPFRVSGNRWLR